MKYAKADCEFVVDAADFFTVLGYNVNIGLAWYCCQQINAGAITESYRCQSCTNTFTAYDQ